MKNVIVTDNLDYAIESMNLLIHVASQESYGQNLRKYEKKGQNISEKFRKKNEILIQLESDMTKALKNHMEDLNYYFGKKYQEGLNIGQITVLWNGYFVNEDIDFTTWIKEIENLSEREYCKKFSEQLSEYESIVLDEIDESEIKKDSLGVIKQIMDMNASDEEKWRLQNVFLYPEKHKKKVLELMELAYTVLKKHETDLTYIKDNFVEYWTGKLKNINLLEYMKKEIGLELDNNPDGAILRPSICAPNSLNLFANGKDETTNKAYIIRIGVLFDDTYQLSRKVTTKEYSEQALKNLKILSDRSKFEILSSIKNKRAYSSELAKQLNLTTATISHHMSALLSAGLVRIEKEETKIFYRANTSEIEKLLEYCRETLV